MNTAIAIGLIGLLIAVHEAGHYLVARLCRMRVERFSIGFGPALAKFTRGETEWRIGILPFGGYVKIAGMSPGDDIKPDDPASYANQSALRRLAVIVAGSLMNVASAWLLLFVLLVAGGETPSSRLGGIQPGSVAEGAGLREGDRIVALADVQVDAFSELAPALVRHAGETVPLVYERDGVRATVEVTLSAAARLGVTSSDEMVVKRFGPIDAAARATFGVVRSAMGTADGLISLFRGRAEGEVMSVIGLTAEVAKQADRGLQWLVLIAVNLSVALAFFNLLPLPALDGGRALFLFVELVRRRPIDQRAETWVHGLGFLFLIGLFVVFGARDISRLVFGKEDAPAATAPDAGVAPSPAPAPTPDPAPDAGVSPAPAG